MSTNSERASADNAPINLKHRVTGAGVLIFFGVLVLPWLLGPPSEATKNPVVSESVPEPMHSTFEDEILAELEGIDGEKYEQPEETVYVSKITPLSDEAGLSAPQPLVKNNNDDSTAAPKDGKVESDMAESDKTVGISSANKSNQAKDRTAVGAVNKGAQNAFAKAEDNSSEQAKSSETKQTEIAKTTQTVEQPKPTVAVEKTPKVDVGWVVQVELLTDKNGADRLVSELREKGFSPSTTIVDTNRGKKTGTRIWLGPFAQRAQAGLENDKLESKMGKRGFVRVYP